MGQGIGSTKPYLIRAIRDWAMDNGLTPHLLVDATCEGVEVPGDAVQDGQVVLNVDDRAVRDWHVEADWLWFSARFGGRPFNVNVPVDAVLAVYARENGQGIAFQDGPRADPPAPAGGPPRPQRPTLKVVK